MNTPEFCQNHAFSQFCFRNFFPEPRVMALGFSRNAWGLQTFRLIKPGFRLIKPGTPGPHPKSAQSPQSVPKSIPRTADFERTLGPKSAQSPQSGPKSTPKSAQSPQSIPKSIPQSTPKSAVGPSQTPDRKTKFEHTYYTHSP